MTELVNLPLDINRGIGVACSTMPYTVSVSYITQVLGKFKYFKMKVV